MAKKHQEMIEYKQHGWLLPYRIDVIVDGQKSYFFPIGSTYCVDFSMRNKKGECYQFREGTIPEMKRQIQDAYDTGYTRLKNLGNHFH